MLEAAHSAPLRPQLCERSKHLVARRKLREQQQRHDSVGVVHKLHVGASGQMQKAENGSKTQTVEARQDIKQRSSSAPQVQPVQDKECTFKPKITAYAAKLAPRGTHMLAYTDNQNREHRLATLRKEKQSKEEKDAAENFKPHVNDYNGVGSRLKVLIDSDFTFYANKVKEHRDNEIAKCRNHVKSSREAEEAELTFKPKIHPAPEFVRRMAESFRTVRAVKEKENHARMECFDGGALVDGTKDSQSQHIARPDWK